MAISQDTQSKLDAAFAAQDVAATADAERQAANDVALQAKADAEKAEAKSVAAHVQATNAANAAIAALMQELGLTPPPQALRAWR